MNQKRRGTIFTLITVLTLFQALIGYSGKAHAALFTTNYNDSLQKNLVAWWTFDSKDSLTRITDRSGQGNHAYLRGMSTTSAIVAGKLGQGIKFNGVSTEYVSTNLSSIPLTDVTFSFWARPRAGNATVFHRPIGYENSLAGQHGIGMYFPSDTTPQWIIRNNGGSYDTAAGTITLDTWNMFTLTISSSLGAKIYLNGTQVGQAPGATAYSAVPGYTFVMGSSGDVNAPFVGSMDDVRIYSKALTGVDVRRLYNQGISRINSSLTRTTNPLRQGLTGWWTMDGSDVNWTSGYVNDKSNFISTASRGYITSIATSSVAAGKLGQALRFNGTSSYINTTNSLAQFMSSATGTISAWYYALDGNQSGCNTGTMSPIVEDSDNFGNGGFIFIGYDGNNLCAGGFDAATRFLTTPAPKRVWTHAVLVHKNGQIQLWKNGVFVNARTLGLLADNSYPIVIGRNFNWPSFAYFNGFIDDVRVYSIGLSTTSIQELYQMGQNRLNSSNANALSNGLIGYWTFDGPDTLVNIADRSGMGNHAYMVPGGATSSIFAAGKIGQALRLNGASQYVQTSNAVNVNLSGFSVSAWVNPSTNILPNNRIVENGYTTCFNMYAANNKYYIQMPSGVNVGGSSVVANKWTLVVGTFDGTNATLYQNGQYVDSQPVSPTNCNLPIRIGEYVAGGNYYWPGLIDDVRIYNRALSAREVQQLYSIGR